ncbi:MAG TPA: hypothetical protein VIG77_16660 [Ktedonobacterales bacterium]
MERLNKTLIWLAVVAIAFGLAIAFVLTRTFIPHPLGFSYSSEDGLLAAYFNILSSQTINLAIGLSTLLNGGVITLAAAMAFVNRRWGWLIVLIVVTLLTLLWPPFALILLSRQESQTFPYLHIFAYNFTTLTVPLIPVALALIFALIRRRSAPTATGEGSLG